jgi:hypothetical protein
MIQNSFLVTENCDTTQKEFCNIVIIQYVKTRNQLLSEHLAYCDLKF